MSLWLACRTQEEIAEATGTKQSSISELLSEIATFRFPIKPNHLAEIKDEAERWKAKVADALGVSQQLVSTWWDVSDTNGSKANHPAPDARLSIPKEARGAKLKNF